MTTPANREPGGFELRPVLVSDRLTLHGWQVEDAAAALAVYGHPAVVRWLSPDMDRVRDLPAMRLLLQQWIAETARTSLPSGHWAVRRRGDGRIIGGAILLPLPPGNEDIEIGWQLHPDVWGQGYASEATHALARWAFRHDVDELFAVVRPGNTRAAGTVRGNGMHWVGETDKYFGLELQVFRLRTADLDESAPRGHLPPGYDLADR
ncbi:RimJ/RimL family protein N-acetyltransferase [Crossiella equi]|uniref:RimJ/RimL family protein N-acetyltransferase n=1 Tax=Crossiella equi TaxID=130796 RepID=A0ABS5ARV1_9PSEU|nr:GNAT family N-acetyltransferase [Crossiella equi]MBP2479293.1 RimJ/RimL family protein N-acetyltransferase [Crossiella equi]